MFRLRGGSTALAIGLSLIFGLMTATPSVADTNTYADTTGEAGVPARTDISTYRVQLTETAFTITVTMRGTPSDPFDGRSRLVVWITTSEDAPPDLVYRAAMKPDASWELRRGRTVTACDLSGAITYSAATLTIPASCIGTPSSVRVALQTGEAYGSEFGDVAPTVNLGLYGVPGFRWSAPVSSGPELAPTSTPQVKVYRFWSQQFDNAHFFTTSEPEAEAVYFDPNWQLEGVAFGAMVADGESCTEGSPVFRFYSPAFQSHFYTQAVAEKNAIIASDRNWTYEGVSYCAYPQATEGATPLYRFWSPKFGKHFYTANQGEADHIVAYDRNWNYEGVAYYVLP